jgi:hypothetical protein
MPVSAAPRNNAEGRGVEYDAAARRGEQSRRQGAAAEQYARGLIASHFDQYGPPELDRGADIAAQLDPPLNGAPFLFQVKHGQGFRVSSRSLSWLLDSIESIAVVFLHVERPTPHAPVYRFLLLHDWALAHPDWPDRLKAARLSFKLGDFTVVDEFEENFRQAMEDEARRVLKRPTTDFGSATFQVRQPHDIALGEVELFRELGHLTQFEIPAPVLDELLRIPGLTHNQLQYLSQLRERPAQQDPTLPAGIRSWLTATAPRPEPDAVLRETRQFSQFVTAMRAYREGASNFSMPGHTWDEISAWRIFLGVFPKGMSLVEAMFTAPTRWTANQLAAGVTLLGALATYEGTGTTSRATVLLDSVGERLGLRAHDYRDYDLTRAYWCARAEAGLPGAETTCLNFIARHYRPDAENRELALHQRYYGTDSLPVIKGFVNNRITAQRPRDNNTSRLLDALATDFL